MPAGPSGGPRSSTCDVSLIWPIQASTDTVMNTTEELHSVTTQYVVDNVAAQLHPAPSSSWEASPNVVIQDVREGAKGSKKRCEQRRQDILS
jgi:hypothetical protein